MLLILGSLVSPAQAEETISLNFERFSATDHTRAQVLSADEPHLVGSFLLPGKRKARVGCKGEKPDCKILKVVDAEGNEVVMSGGTTMFRGAWKDGKVTFEQNIFVPGRTY
jgi:hypothetical protein